MDKTETKKLSFELNEDMLALIAEEFGAREVADVFAKAATEKGVQEATEEVFAVYGRQLGHRSLQLGSEYSDRTYEVMLEAIDHTGAYKFPLLPQRFLEIAYLSVQDIYAFPIRVNSSGLLRFEIKDCKIFKELQEKCAKENLKEVPCRTACINLIKTVCTHFDLDVTVEADTQPLENNTCVFSVIKG